MTTLSNDVDARPVLRQVVVERVDAPKMDVIPGFD